MQEFGAQLDRFSALDQLVVPDLWQQEAVQHLRAGKDVVVHAATGAGKTFIFELWSNEGRNPGQAIYTVPTRALANDKLAEWRARGWNVGIATGDLSENLDAPVIVATLETQKNRLINGDGPRLLVIDEYQMLGDADRGLNYELAIAMAPPQTQLSDAQRQRGQPQARRRLASAPPGPGRRVGLARRQAGAARGGVRRDAQLRRPSGDSRLLAKVRRQGAGGGAWAGFEFLRRAAAQQRCSPPRSPATCRTPTPSG